MEFLNSRYSQYISYFLLMALVFTLTACGASKKGTTQFSELASRTDLGGSKILAYCNKASGFSLSYKVMAQYVDGSYDPNIAHVRLYTVPAAFESNATYIQFWRGAASSDTTISHNTTATSFSIYDLQTQAYVKVGLTSLHWNDVKDLFPGSTASAFLARVMFVLDLQDPNGQYTVLTATAYGTASNAVQDSLDALIPAFYAHPSDYAYKTNGMPRETILRNMHPFNNQSGDYAALATSLCQ